MKRFARSLALALSLIALLGAAPVAARHDHGSPPPPTSASWQLVDYAQKICFSPVTSTSSFGIWISGTWTRSIDVGIDGLPAGASYGTAYAPIAPGSSDGIYSLAYVRVTLKGGHDGTTTSSLWASDGVVKESVPVTIVVQASCRDY